MIQNDTHTYAKIYLLKSWSGTNSFLYAYLERRDSMLDALSTFITNNNAFVLVGAVTLIEVAPIKLNPWSNLIKWISKKLNADMHTELQELKKEHGEMRQELKELKRDFEDTKAKNMRWNILDFANSCRNGRRHDKEEWGHVMDQLIEYENYTREKNITNGVIEEDTKYLRALYQEILRDNDFLLERGD